MCPPQWRTICKPPGPHKFFRYDTQVSSTRIYEEHVREIIKHVGEMRERERTFTIPEGFGEALAKVPAGEEMTLAVRLESVHEGILVSANIDTTMHAECGRCLTSFKAPFEIDFQELFPYTRTEADEYEVHGDHVDLEPPLRDAVVLALPFQPVCRLDCPGLDPESGAVRDAEVAAVPAAQSDPRWAALAGLLAENNDGDRVSDPESK